MEDNPDALSERDVIANRCKSIVESEKILIVVFSFTSLLHIGCREHDDAL